MALMQCRECGNAISDQAFACPRCGAPIRAGISPHATLAPAQPQKYWTTGRLLIGVIVTLGILWFTGAIPACLHIAGVM